MKKILMISLALILTACAAGPVYCQEEIPANALSTFDGKVLSVDPAGASLTVSGGIEMTFPVIPDTKFVNEMYASENAEDLKLSDLKKGDYVSVDYYTNDTGVIKTLSVRLKFEQSKDSAYPG